MKQGAVLTLIGTAIGLGIAYLSGRIVASQIYAIRASDPLMLGAAILLVAAITGIATISRMARRKAPAVRSPAYGVAARRSLAGPDGPACTCRSPQSRDANLAPRTSHFALRTSHFAPRASRLAPRASRLALRTSHFALRTSHFALRPSPLRASASL